jgi:hypothetical protein
MRTHHARLLKREQVIATRPGSELGVAPRSLRRKAAVGSVVGTAAVQHSGTLSARQNTAPFEGLEDGEGEGRFAVSVSFLIQELKLFVGDSAPWIWIRVGGTQRGASGGRPLAIRCPFVSRTVPPAARLVAHRTGSRTPRKRTMGWVVRRKT